MAFDENVFNTEFATEVRNSGNTATNNSTNVAVDLDRVGNSDNSVNDSGNWTIGVDDSFKDNSGNESWDIDDSGNTGSYNTDVDVTDASTTDNSVNAGVREYNTGFSGSAGLGGAAGDLTINNQNTVVDQSVNQNILSGGGVFQYHGSETVVASGTGSIAAGDDVSISQTLDRSTTIDSGGDVLISSSKTVDVAIGSGNTTNVDVAITDSSQSWDLDNVGNQYSAVLDIEGSFNETDTSVDYDDWDVDANVIWDSDLAAIGDVDIDG